MRKIFCISFVLFYFWAGYAFGHPTAKGHIHTLATEERTFSNSDCEKNDTCDLKSFFLRLEKYEVWLSDDSNPTYGDSIVAMYETDFVEKLKKYVVVQFIRGCVFDTWRETGEIRKRFGYSIMHFGELKYFCFPDWVIDSVDTDPVYFSDPELGRFYFYKWNTIPSSFHWRTTKYYGQEKPTHPRLYVTDVPAQAFVGEFSVKNVSLEFRTCLYKVGDVPFSATPENINFATPIRCFEWQSSYIYNFDLGIFETKNEIDTFCKQKPPTY